MNNKFLISLIILLVGCVIISASSAADVNENMVIDDVSSNLVIGDSSSVSSASDSVTVEVSDEPGLRDAIANESVNTIKITEDIELNARIIVERDNLKIDGQGHEFTPSATGYNYTRDFSGGAFNWQGDWGCLTNCTFLGFQDSKITDGGAIYWTGNNGSIICCGFGGNKASNRGGAICLLGNDSVISQCGFSDNTAGKEGNSIFVDSSNSNINYCQFEQATPEGAKSEMYISHNSKDVTVAYNNMQTNPEEGFYSALEIDSGEQFGDWATVRLAKNTFRSNYILNNGEIISPIKMVFDSKVVKKGDTAVITGTIYDDNGNYIVTDGEIFAYVDDGDEGYLGHPCDLFYYFYIPTKDLSVGVHKLTSSIVEENDNVTFEGTLTVVDSDNPNPSPKKGIPMEHAGNPLVVLLIGLVTVGLGSLKRKL